MKDELRREAEYLRRRAEEALEQGAAESTNRRTERKEWLERQKDYNPRRAHCDAAASLKSLLRATGYNPETLDMFVSVSAATHGKGGLEACVNWRVGVYLDGGSDVDVERLERKPADDADRTLLKREQATYAQKAKRAYQLVLEEERRTGYKLLDYQPGSKNRNEKQGMSSKWNPLFIQYQVEIERREASYRGKGVSRLTRFDRAAREFVATLPCHPETAEERAARLEREARTHQEWQKKRARSDARRPERVAERKVKSYLKKVELAAEELTASGLDLDELKRTAIEALTLTATSAAAALPDPEERATFIRQLIEQLSDRLADTLPCEDETSGRDGASAEYPLAVNDRYSEPEFEAVQEPAAAESSHPPTFEPVGANSNKNGNSRGAQVFKFEYLTDAPGDLSPPDLEEREERAAILEHVGGLPRKEAERRAFGAHVVSSCGV